MRRVLWLTITAVSFALISSSVYADAAEPNSILQDSINQEGQGADGQAHTEQERSGWSEQPAEIGQDKEHILSLVNTVEVEALIKDRCRLYSDETRKKYVKTLPKGEKVRLLRDKSQKTAYIKLKDGSKG